MPYVEAALLEPLAPDSAVDGELIGSDVAAGTWNALTCEDLMRSTASATYRPTG